MRSFYVNVQPGASAWEIGRKVAPRPHGRRAGFVAVRWLTALGLVAVVGAGAWAWARCREHARTCEARLHELYAFFELYELQHGVLPTLAFYPNEPRRDGRSLRVLVEQEGLNGEVCVCPAAPRLLREAGLTYLWNPALNGRRLADQPEPRWMLVEVHALSDEVPRPHFGSYHVLFTDGRVVRCRQPPSDLPRQP